MPEKFQDLAKRWLQAKRTELLTGNSRERENADAEADDAQREMSDQAVDEAVRAALPGLANWQDDQAAREAAEAERDRAEILALPKAAVDMSVIGPSGTASWQGEFHTRAECERDEATGEVTLRVALETPDELAPQIAGQPLYALRVEVRPYDGPGRYDPARLGADVDPMDYTVEYGSRDEAFCLAPELGSGMVEVTEGEEQLDLGLPLQGAGGDLRVTATITLPPIRDLAVERAAVDAEERRAFLATLPTANVQLELSGPAASGTWSGELAAMVSRQRDDDTGGTTLQFAFATSEAPAPQLAGMPLYGLRLELPRYGGPGRYDLGSRPELEPDAILLVLGGEEEPFTWSPQFGPGSVALGPDERSLDVAMAMRGPTGDLHLTATILLPENPAVA